jgi:hypothetical protein
MTKVQLRDGRVKEFKGKVQAERYAEATGGTIVASEAKKVVKRVITRSRKTEKKSDK